MKNSISSNSLFLKYHSQGKDFFEQSFLNPIRANNLFQEFCGAFFRSTLPLGNKLKILDEFFARGDVAEKLPQLIQQFKSSYQIADIPKRNAEWQDWYGI